MKIVIEIPKEFERDVKGKGCLGESNRFVEFFRRVLNDIRYGKCACGNYEEETAEMFADQFGKIQVLDDNHDAEIRRKTLKEVENAMYHEAFEVDHEVDGMQKWDGGNWIRYKLFEKVMEQMKGGTE